MTDQKISDLSAADALTGGELIPIVQAGATRKASALQLADVIGPKEALRRRGIVNIMDFGAIGDVLNISHPLSERFSTLAAAQAVYPNATSLTNEIDGLAIQKAIDYAVANRIYAIEFPSGYFRWSTEINSYNFLNLVGIGTGVYNRETVFYRCANVSWKVTGISITVQSEPFALISRFCTRDFLWDGGDDYGNGYPAQNTTNGNPDPTHPLYRAHFLAPMLDFKACYEFYFTNNRMHSCAGSAIRAMEWWDSRIHDNVVSFCGSLDGVYPAIDLLSGEKSPGHETCNNLSWSGNRRESCPGVLVRSSGNNAVDLWLGQDKGESVDYQLDYIYDFQNVTAVHLNPCWAFANGTTYKNMQYFSTTSATTVGRGDYSFTIDTGIAFNTNPHGKQLFDNMSMIMINRDDPSIYMSGRLKPGQYNPTTGAITITSDFFTGDNTVGVTRWEISPAHPGLINIAQNCRIIEGTIFGGFTSGQNIPFDQPYVLTIANINNSEHGKLHFGVTEGLNRLPANTFQSYNDLTTLHNIGSGDFTFTIETGKTIPVGQTLYIQGKETRYRANHMTAQVRSYDPVATTNNLVVHVDRTHFEGVPADNVTKWTITPYKTYLVRHSGPNLQFGVNKHWVVTGGTQSYGSPVAVQPNNGPNEIDPYIVNGYESAVVRWQNKNTSEVWGWRINSDPTQAPDVNNPGNNTLGNTGQLQLYCYDYLRNKDYTFLGITGDRYLYFSQPIIIQGTSKIWFIDYGAASYKQAAFVNSGEAAPITGAYAKGDIRLNSDPAAFGYMGWSCIGSPLNFKPFGKIVQQATLTDGVTVAWNLAFQQAAIVTLAGNRTLANPTNMTAGERYTLIVKQDGTGGRTLTLGSAFKMEGGTPLSLSTAGNAIDVLDCLCDGTNMLTSVRKAFS